MSAAVNTGFEGDTYDGDRGDLEMTPAVGASRPISVLGSGDFGRAFARRAVTAGFTVLLGTRNKEKQADMMRLIEATGATIVTQSDAISASDVIIMAVSRRFYDQLPVELLANKILVDVSNLDGSVRHKSLLSNAEYLQQLVPSSRVVKAFNVLSAYLLETGGIQGSKEVPIASDSEPARARVAQLTRELGFNPVERGSLRQARDIEAMPMRFFSEWRGAFAVVSAIFLVGYVICFIKFQLCKNLTKNETWDWSVFKQILMTNFNRNLGVVALVILAAVYLSGVVAAFMQLYRGTKYMRFPNWLDRWLRMRKQLGLLMLTMASVHGCMSLGLYHPHHQYDWLFEDPVTISVPVKNNNGTYSEPRDVNIWFHHPSWRGELFLTLGAVTLCLLVVLGVTSLPSVTSRMTWREFSWTQSKLGWTALVTGSLHCLVLGWDYMLTAFACYIPSGLQYALYLPLVCLLGKLVLLVPPASRSLRDIRAGVVRASDSAV